MDSTQIFWMQLLTSVVVFGIVAVWYVWPHLTKLSRNTALLLLFFVHVPRYVGMTLLVAGMVDPKLPRDFLSSAAYGDLLESVLALASIFALRGNWRIAVPLVWVTNTWGFMDLLSGGRRVLQLNVPSFNLATFWYVYTFYAPLVVVSHLMIFWVLMKSRSWNRVIARTPPRTSASVTRHNPPTMWDMASLGFSHISVADPGRLAFLSGQIAATPASGEVPKDLAGQARLATASLAAALKELGASPQDIVMLRVYVVNATSEAFGQAVTPLRELFGDAMPSITTIGVQALYKPEIMVEIEMVVRLPGKREIPLTK
jgi:enamine deaminase RidA (YjgF/YER057c/UK114 family)